MTDLVTISKMHNTTSIKMRKQKLRLLKEKILLNEEKICEALKADLGKSEFESYMTEIGLVLNEISFLSKKLEKLLKKKKVKTPLAQFKATSNIYYKPYGNVLVLSPWNYPFLLSLEPLLGAYAAGNSVVLKPSEYSAATSNVIKEILESVFAQNEVVTILGDATVSQELLAQPFDYIFFTGSSRVGQIVYEMAAKNLTPVTLELGGKSPVLVDGTYDLALTARRIVFGKFLNAGQTCVAPDYLIVKEDVKEELIKALIKEMQRQFKNALKSDSYGKIISRKHFDRLVNFIAKDDLIYGGNYEVASLKIEPTLLNASLSSSVMQEEIFGPILPILTYQKEEDIERILGSIKTPLAFYIFSSDKHRQEYWLEKYEYGGATVNDTVVHLASNLPFGGFKNSGLGSYHHEYTLYTFLHETSVLKRGKLDLNMRYQPYSKKNLRIIKKLLK